MIDGDEKTLTKELQYVVYIPGISQRLFSITHFTKFGHYALFQDAAMILQFSPSWALITMMFPHKSFAFSANLKNTGEEQVVDKISSAKTEYHVIPEFRNNDSST
jgi:hypothetical protein